MRHRTFASGLIGIALVALIAGCAGPTADSAGAKPAAFDESLVGTWNGLFWAPGEFYYPIEGIMVLQINEDRTFTVTVSPTGAANNIAKPGSWSGTVSQEHGLVVFHATKGAFPVFSSLKRSGSGELYGVANDPASGGGDIAFKFKRADRGTAGGQASGSGK
jgi:hypothetical protein